MGALTAAGSILHPSGGFARFYMLRALTMIRNYVQLGLSSATEDSLAIQKENSENKEDICISGFCR